MSKGSLAVAILTLNEETDLPRCLTSLEKLDCSIFVFDSGSTDQTCEIALSAGAQVVPFKWNRTYPKKKQWALDYLKDDFDWVLLLDADESLSPALATEITRVITTNDSALSAFDAVLDYWFEGVQLKFGMKATKRVLMRPAQTQFPVLEDLEVTNMWEVEGHYQPLTEGVVGTFASKLTHYDSDGLFAYFNRHNRYSDWEAYVRKNPKLAKQVLSARPLKARLLNALPLKGLLVFTYGYIFKLGFLDGRAGFDFAANQATYYWQIRAKELRA